MKKSNRGFTLVEVLICVGIIGIIAAITIPALVSSTSEKALEAQRKALQSRMAQAFGQIKNLKLYEQSTLNADNITYTDNGSALNFITQSLSKVYKLTNVCDVETIRECGITNEIYDYWSDTEEYKYVLNNKITLGGASGLNEAITSDMLNGLSADYAAFKTANGESVLLWYNPKCVSKSEANQDNMLRSVCVNMVYDLNGKKAPNAYGEDIGVITVFYPTDPTVVMPILHHEISAIYTEDTYGNMLAKASEEGLVPPTLEELVSILVNKNLTHVSSLADPAKLYWSSSYTSDDTTKAWAAGLNLGLQQQQASGASAVTHGYFLLKK